MVAAHQIRSLEQVNVLHCTWPVWRGGCNHARILWVLQPAAAGASIGRCQYRWWSTAVNLRLISAGKNMNDASQGKQVAGGW